MATVYQATTSVSGNQRRALVPAEDPTAISASTATSRAVDGKLHYVQAGDIIDVGMDWSAWLKANDGQIVTSAWAAHANSPQAPTLGADGIDQAECMTVTHLDLSAATVGDVYYISNTITVGDATSGQSNTYDIPTRTLTRTMYVQVVL